MIYAALHTDGLILELGAGDYSTPLLHAISGGTRQVITLENDADWLKRFDAFRSPWHEFRHVADWKQAIAEVCQSVSRFGLVFVDQRPSTARGKAIRQLHGVADGLRDATVVVEQQGNVFKDGTIRAKKLSDRSYQVDLRDIPAQHQ